MWTPNAPVKDLPELIQEFFVEEAKNLLIDLEENYEVPPNNKVRFCFGKCCV